MFIKVLIPVCLSFVVLGCSTSKVIDSGQNTYMVTSSSVGFATYDVRENVFKSANEYCDSRGKKLKTVSFNSRSGVLGSHPPQADLTFKCLDANSPELNDVNLSEKDREVKVDVKTIVNNVTEEKIIEKLKRLNDLYKSGAISNDEYKLLRAKVLDGL